MGQRDLQKKVITPDPSAPNSVQMIESGLNRVIRLLAKESSVTTGKAADQVDKVVHDMLRKLKRGQVVSMPGVGKLAPGTNPQVIEEANVDRNSARTRRRGR